MIYRHLVSFFEGAPWPSLPHAEAQTVSFVYPGTAGPWQTHVKAFEEEQQVAVYGVVPFPIVEERRPAAAELIARINDGLVIGNFELDFADGVIRYKTSLDVEGAQLTDRLLLQLVRANLSCVDAYLPALVAFANGGLSPVDALAIVE